MAFGDKIKINPDSILMKYVKSIIQTTTSTADTNIVTDSEGNTNQITIKNGNKGSAGAKGADGNSGNLQPYITCYMWKRTA